MISNIFSALFCSVATGFISIISLIFRPLSNADFSGAETAFNYIFNIIQGITYFLPLNTVISILSISLLLYSFRLVIVILKTIWSILPLL